MVVAGDFNEDSLVLPRVRTGEETSSTCGGREGARALLQGYDSLSDDDADAVIRRAGKVLNFLEMGGEELVGAGKVFSLGGPWVGRKEGGREGEFQSARVSERISGSGSSSVVDGRFGPPAVVCARGQPSRSRECNSDEAQTH